ncbi:HEPN domain protein [Spirochaeta thermophila DSM 6578]|uniref:HEPN domain protein n=1 Tax=Winmispira thermophila (strain ATCC 700085 / DSM 6578 / Z-1203) TaxID=869211 RepID=G0GAS1_WINT7|nr:HEPN domain-containing protein [Spirochaeta thermophila]AEJ61817.1 HEPN domain protein [Spirochaeta thermophila DSM 6578]
MTRWKDWWTQAEADLRHAQHSLEAGDYEWACFAAHQAAEKALKAVYAHRLQPVWGHTITYMLQHLKEEGVEIPPPLIEAACVLDKHYIPTRYPNGLPEGAPTEFYTRKEAEDALRYSEEILRFARHLLG